MADSRPGHEEFDKQIRSQQQICRGKGLVITILSQNSKSGTGRQADGRTDTGTSRFAPQIKIWTGPDIFFFN